MYALVAPVLVFGAGAAIDYGRAAQIRTKLNAAADAAALAALTPAMLQQTATVAQAAAVSMFNGLTDSISGLTPGATPVSAARLVQGRRGHQLRREFRLRCRQKVNPRGEQTAQQRDI